MLAGLLVKGESILRSQFLQIPDPTDTTVLPFFEVSCGHKISLLYLKPGDINSLTSK